VALILTGTLVHMHTCTHSHTCIVNPEAAHISGGQVPHHPWLRQDQAVRCTATAQVQSAPPLPFVQCPCNGRADTHKQHRVLSRDANGIMLEVNTLKQALKHTIESLHPFLQLPSRCTCAFDNSATTARRCASASRVFTVTGTHRGVKFKILS